MIKVTHKVYPHYQVKKSIILSLSITREELHSLKWRPVPYICVWGAGAKVGLFETVILQENGEVDYTNFIFFRIIEGLPYTFSAVKIKQGDYVSGGGSEEWFKEDLMDPQGLIKSAGLI